MRAIHFMMIDYTKVKQQLYFIPLFVVIAAAMGFSNLGALSYMLFVAIIYATAPFGACKREDAGFLVLLPSTVTHRVLGRFLYGISVLGIAVVVSGILTVVHQTMYGQKMEPWTAAAGLLLLAFCMLAITVEFLILYLVGEHLAPQLLGIVRMAPAMFSFFGMMYLMGDGAEGARLTVIRVLDSAMMQIGCIAVVVAFAALLAAMAVCVKVTGKRDYV